MTNEAERQKPSGAGKAARFLSAVSELGMTDQERVARALKDLFERVTKLEATK